MRLDRDRGVRAALRGDGTLLRAGERDTRFRFTQTILIHDWLMYVCLLLFLGHLDLAVIHPAARHALSGMTRGWVNESWSSQHHAKSAAATTDHESTVAPTRQA